MPSDDHELKAVESRLTLLVRCIIAKAETDAEFAGSLKEIFLSDAARVALGAKQGKKKARTDFDPISFLSSRGAEALRLDLSSKPTSTLADIARHYRVVSPKYVKGMEREELITKLVVYAEQKLGQGGAFLKSSSSTIQPLVRNPSEDNPA